MQVSQPTLPEPARQNRHAMANVPGRKEAKGALHSASVTRIVNSLTIAAKITPNAVATGHSSVAHNHNLHQ